MIDIISNTKYTTRASDTIFECKFEDVLVNVFFWSRKHKRFIDYSVRMSWRKMIEEDQNMPCTEARLAISQPPRDTFPRKFWVFFGGLSGLLMRVYIS